MADTKETGGPSSTRLDDSSPATAPSSGRQGEPPPATDKRAWLLSQQEALEGQHRRLGLHSAAWSWVRLTVFTLGACFVVTLLLEHLVVAGAAVAVGLGILFGWAVHRHNGVEDRLLFNERIRLMTEEALRRESGKIELIRAWPRPAEPREPGFRLVPIIASGPTSALTDQERDDLDIFSAPVGIFGLLNRTSTALGACRLRDMLDRPMLRADRILLRQGAVRWLDEHPSERCRLMAAAADLRSRDGELDRLVEAFCQTAPLQRTGGLRALRVWARLCGVVALGAAGMAFAGWYAWASVIGAIVAVNVLILVRVRPRIRRFRKRWQGLLPAVTALLAVARRSTENLPDEPPLGAIRRCFAAAIQRHALPSLQSRLAWLEVGGLIHVFLNALLLYDLHVEAAVLATAARNRDALLRSASALADQEALCSLASFAWEQPVACYPVPAQRPLLSISSGCHPLIPPSTAVPGDVELTGTTRVWIITGANASGKSTLLRMAGVNALLAQVGTVAIARGMTWSPMFLVTDLRIRDSLTRKESYFMAEVRQLRRIIATQTGGYPLLGLVDEPFRGTNWLEKRAAGPAVVEHILALGRFLLVATHDVGLPAVADGVAAKNYHFDAQLDSHESVFTFRLCPGPAEGSSVLQILESEGYPQSALARARALLAGFLQGGSAC